MTFFFLYDYLFFQFCVTKKTVRDKRIEKKIKERPCVIKEIELLHAEISMHDLQLFYENQAYP